MNSNWARWIFASISKHFDDGKGSYDMYIEGQHRNTRVLKDFFELRIDGPNICEVSKNYYEIIMEVNCLVSSHMDDTDYHRIHRTTGYVAALYTDIPVYKYGTGPDDDQSFLGCLVLINDIFGRKGNRLVISNFGIVEPGSDLLQSTIEGHYRMCLNGS